VIFIAERRFADDHPFAVDGAGEREYARERERTDTVAEL
jgi:hypothetical protein